MNSKKFWKLFLISLGCVLFIGLVGGAIFLFAKNPFGLKTPKLNIYSEILDWCEYSSENNTINFECKALLIDISNIENNSSCFEVQIITKEKNLKNLSVCENNSVLTYTNEILGYKKLMPIDIGFNYAKNGILNNYAFSKASFAPMNEEYVHSMVNEDIANFVATDIGSVTSIKNSANFCPNTDILPNFISEPIKSLYQKFLDENQISGEIPATYNNETENLNIFLNTMSIGNEIFPNNPVNLTIPQDYIPPTPKWGKALTKYDFAAIAQLSMLYDNENAILPTFSPYSSTTNNGNSKVKTQDTLDFIFKEISLSTDISEEEYCTAYLLSKKIQGSEANESINKMREIVINNLENTRTPLCLMYDEDSSVYDKVGAYIHYALQDGANDFSVVNSCVNLAIFFR